MSVTDDDRRTAEAVLRKYALPNMPVNGELANDIARALADARERGYEMSNPRGEVVRLEHNARVDRNRIAALETTLASMREALEAIKAAADNNDFADIWQIVTTALQELKP